MEAQALVEGQAGAAGDCCWKPLKTDAGQDESRSTRKPINMKANGSLEPLAGVSRVCQWYLRGVCADTL